MKVARIYIRVSTAEQDLSRQAEIEHGAFVMRLHRDCETVAARLLPRTPVR